MDWQRAPRNKSRSRERAEHALNSHAFGNLGGPILLARGDFEIEHNGPQHASAREQNTVCVCVFVRGEVFAHVAAVR